MTQLYLIRHASGGPLTELGVRQAERLRDRLAATGEIRADVLISSTMLRASQTAQIVAPALGLTAGTPMVLDDEIVERHAGDPAELARRWPDGGGPNWVVDPHAAPVPGSESPSAFTRRVSRALARITAEHAGKTVVIVCHGGVIGSATLYFAGLDTAAACYARMFPLPEHVPLLGRPWLLGFRAIEYTSITHWRRDAGGGGLPVWELERFNDALHLRDLDSDQRLNWSALRPTMPRAGAT